MSSPNALVGDLKANNLRFPTKTFGNDIGSEILRQIIIPQLTKEVNQGQNFAQLRQVYNSLILATWYKKKIRDSILAQVYSDRNKINGIRPIRLRQPGDMFKSEQQRTCPQAVCRAMNL